MNRVNEKVVGILGGMGPEATVDLFRKIVYNTDAKRDQDHLRIIIDNNPKIPDRTSSIETGDRTIVDFLKKTAQNLERAGADFIIIPCNTAHYFSEEVENSVKIPVVNMITETVHEVEKNGNVPVAILATNGTMKVGLYQRELEKRGLTYIEPDKKSQEKLMRIIMGVKSGGDKVELSRMVLEEIKKLIERGAKSFILGCTELPLVFPFEWVRKPVFDSTNILAKSAIEYAKKDCD